MSLTKVTSAETSLATITANGATSSIAPKIQVGRARIQANTGTEATITVTFPSAFSGIPSVTTSFNGYATYNTAWTDTPLTDWAGLIVSPLSPTATGFTARCRRFDGATLGSDYYFTWVAIGA